MKLKKMRFQLAVLLALCMSHLTVMGQSDPSGESAVTTTYAFTNATVITSPGNQLTDATVVIKNGLIMGVGSNVTIPADARVIDATDMFIYPAFIDGMSNTGAKRPDSPDRPNDLFTPDPPNDYAGITPEKSVVAQLDIESSDVSQLREAGFGIAHTVPHGRMLPGTSALLVLKDGEHVDEWVFKPNYALFAQWVGAPGAYPNNILGMMAKWRNLYRNAVNNKSHVEMYSEDPSGLPRPTNDRVSKAFFPVLDREQPVFFNVQEMLDVRRAMRLQNDLGFNLMVGGVEQAWMIMDELKSTNTPIFMSLDLPDAPKSSKDEDKSDEVKALEERRLEFYKKHVTQAAEMEKAGIRFGFSTDGTRANQIKKHLMTLIENGLSEDAALAALTTTPAQMFGIDQVVGTVQTGKLGNIMITTAPYFEKDANVKMMVIDGQLHEYKAKSKSSAPAADASGDALAGSWTFAFQTPQGATEGTMTFTKTAEGYTGIMSFDNGQPDSDLNDVSFRDGTLSFNLEFEAGGQGLQVVVNGTVNGNIFDGTLTVDQFDFSTPINATKDGK